MCVASMEQGIEMLCYRARVEGDVNGRVENPAKFHWHHAYHCMLSPPPFVPPVSIVTSPTHVLCRYVVSA